MATKTTAQKKAAAKKAAATKAANVKAAQTTTPQTGTDATSTTDTQGTTDAQTSTDEQPQTGGAQAPTSIFDQAVAFSTSGRAKDAKAPSALDLWNGTGCEDLPPKLAVAVFDCAVQQGETVAVRLLDKVIAARLDEVATPETEAEAVTDFLAWRLRRYAFTGNASTKMLEWSQHILRLQVFVRCDLDAG